MVGIVDYNAGNIKSVQTNITPKVCIGLMAVADAANMPQRSMAKLNAK